MTSGAEQEGQVWVGDRMENWDSVDNMGLRPPAVMEEFERVVSVHVACDEA